MNKAALHKVTNIALFISFAVEALTGIILLSRSIVSKALPLSTILEIHEYNGVIFVTLVIVHVYLNWGWVRANILKR